MELWFLTVPADSSENFIVKVQIPADAAIGTVDTTTITAVSGNDPSNKATATAVSTVSEPLTLTPDNTGSGGKGSSAFYNHRVQNNTASSQTVSFSTEFLDPCTGWTKVTPETVTLSPFGGYEDIVVKVTIPSTAVAGDVCRVTVTATAGGNSALATDTTTVKDIVLYSDPDYTNESYIFPVGNAVYARAFGTLSTTYRFYWYDSSNNLKRTSPLYTGPEILSDTYDPIAGPLGTWRVEVRRVSDNALFAQAYFYVGPDHVNASYTGPNPRVNTNVTINLTLHDKDNHVVPIDPATGNVVQGNPPTTKDPLKITVSVNGSATIVSTTLSGAVIVGQTVTGNLDSVTGTATITITDSVTEIVTITPASYNSALYGSPSRDEPTTVSFKKIKIVDWREILP
ncbi:MAG: hypothetical protein HY805_06015 [Nitrospirae bacterium]|nr:hypothetical protein [Nitrospirota bacterium]